MIRDIDYGFQSRYLLSVQDTASSLRGILASGSVALHQAPVIWDIVTPNSTEAFDIPAPVSV